MSSILAQKLLGVLELSAAQFPAVACVPPSPSISRGIRHISTNFSLKPVTLPASSVTRIPSVVDSSVARIIAREWASSSVLRSSASFGPDKFLLGTLAREENASWRSARQRSAAASLRSRLRPSSSSDYFRRERSAEHPRPDLCKRRFAAGRSVVAEWREAAVVRGTQLLDRNVFGRFEDPVANFFRRLNARVDRRDDADENPLVGLHVIPDDLQHADTILFAREGNVKIARLQLEQAGQQLGVIDIRAVGRVAVAARTGMHPDALAILGGESRQREIVQIDEAVQQISGGIDLDRQPAFREVDLNLVAPFSRQLRISVSCSRSRSWMNCLAGVAGNLVRPDTSGSKPRAK